MAYKRLSELLSTLGLGKGFTRFIHDFKRGIREGKITATYTGETFKHTHNYRYHGEEQTRERNYRDMIYDDGPEFTEWLKHWQKGGHRRNVVTPEMLAERPEEFKRLAEKTRQTLMKRHQQGQKLAKKRK